MASPSPPNRFDILVAFARSGLRLYDVHGQMLLAGDMHLGATVYRRVSGHLTPTTVTSLRPFTVSP